MKLEDLSFMKPVAFSDKYEKIYNDNDWIAEVKYDGERYICRLINENNICFNKFTSLHKNSKTDKFVEKTDRFPHLNSLNHDLDKTILDGEIVGKTLQDTVSITGSLASRAIQLQKEKGWLRYRVFDCLFYKGKDIRHYPYIKRRAYLKKIVEELNSKYISLSSASRNKRELLSKVYLGNGEGIVLKNINSVYTGKSHKDWIKVKKTINVDVIIMGYENGKGKFNKEKVGAIIYGAYTKDGILEQWGTVGGMTNDVINELTNNSKENLNKVIEIECQGYTNDNNLRHPRFCRFRNDKQPKKCIKGGQI